MRRWGGWPSFLPIEKALHVGKSIDLCRDKNSGRSNPKLLSGQVECSIWITLPYCRKKEIFSER